MDFFIFLFASSKQRLIEEHFIGVACSEDVEYVAPLADWGRKVVEISF